MMTPYQKSLGLPSCAQCCEYQSIIEHLVEYVPPEVLGRLS